MKKFFKWFGIIVGAVVVLVVAALLIAPMFVDLQKFKPIIENTVEEATGRSFAMGGDLELSLFPWAGVTLKDVSLGNPKGFETDSFAQFSEFEVRMKLLPLISGDVQVKHVVLKGLRLVLEKKKDGEVNWSFDTGGENVKETSPAEAAPAEAVTEAAGGALPVKSLAVGEISVEDGSIVYIDRSSDLRKELADVNIKIANISLEAPVDMSLSGNLDGSPFSLVGTVGPIGTTPGEGEMQLDMTAQAFNILKLTLTGKVRDAATAPAYSIHVGLATFSPKRLLRAVAPDTELSTSDPDALEKFGLEVDISGNTEAVALTDGNMILDDTTTTFEVTAKEFSNPNLGWTIHMDSIDLDRYLPESENTDDAVQTEGGGSSGGKTGNAAETAEIDYTPLRTLVLDGSVTVDQLKAGGGTVRNIVMKVTGKGGKFNISPLSMDLYEGSVQVESSVDVTGKKPKSALQLDVEGIEIEPMLEDFLDKDFITGTTLAEISLSMTGDTPDEIKQTLNGTGNLQFNDGKIRHVNILGMIQNLQAAFGSGSATASDETEFSEFQSRFTITNGVVNTTETTVSSPVLRVDVTGSADLVAESLDFTVNPTYINPKNQKESGMSISGNQVPVLVTGTFSKPKFKPDLETAAKKVVTEKLTDKLSEVLGGSKTSKEDDESDSTSVEDSVKGILKSLPFGK